MTLSEKVKARIRVAIANKDKADELIADIEAGANPVAAHIADVSTVNASDLATAIALANANKAKINAILAALQAAGSMA